MININFLTVVLGPEILAIHGEGDIVKIWNIDNISIPYFWKGEEERWESDLASLLLECKNGHGKGLESLAVVRMAWLESRSLERLDRRAV